MIIINTPRMPAADTIRDTLRMKKAMDTLTKMTAQRVTTFVQMLKSSVPLEEHMADRSVAASVSCIERTPWPQ